MIKLYFIKNISRLDTIRFADEAQRTIYFSNFIETNIDAIYPPHFQNRIQISIEDLSPSTKVNYLSLTYEGKVYYYFIDNINYINEGVYELDITMDTITTFMFDLSINDAILERTTINRWFSTGNEIEINRNYIRENLSMSDFIVKDYQKVNTNEQSCIIFKTRSEFLVANAIYGYDCRCNIQNVINGEYKALNDGTLYIILPLPNNFDFNKIRITYTTHNNITGEYVNSNYTIAQGDYLWLINHLVESPYIVDAYICNNDFVTNVLEFLRTTIEEDDGREYKILEYRLKNGTNNFSTFYPLEKTLTISESPLIKITFPILKEIYCNNVETNINISNFSRNTSLNADFTIFYIPQLLDENYFKVFFGERLGYVTYPLYKLKQEKIKGVYNFDIITGNRIFTILNYSTLSYKKLDEELVTAINQSKETMNLYSDRFQNYMSTNVGTLTTGVALAKANAQWNAGKRLYGAYQNNNSGSALYTINGGLNSNKLASSIGNYAIALGDSYMEYYNIEKQLQVARENAEYSPDTTRLGNSFTSDLIASSLDIMIRIEMVKDLVYVAKKYEQFGYLVNEEIKNRTLYNDFNNRYYFNVVKLKNVDIELDYINNVALIKNISDRLENGIRLWNMHEELYTRNPVIDYNKFDYDNVENIYIE